MGFADWPHVALWVGSREDRVQGVCCYHPEYVREILEHAGIFYLEPPREVLAAGRIDQGVLLFVGNVGLTSEEQAGVRAHLEAGGAAVFVAHPSGAWDLLGIEAAPSGAFVPGFVPLGEGYLCRGEHPVVAGVPRPLHYFGGTAARAISAKVLAGGLDALGRPHDRPLVTEHRVGAGTAIFIAADLPGAVSLIQHGAPVHMDRPSAADGSINTADGILKCDDGCVLHYDLDRDCPPEAVPLFATPVADCWREVLLRALFFAADVAGVPLPMLWYYPRNLPGLAMLSFDSDLNDPDLARRHLDNCRRMGIRGTWAIIEPGYNDEFLQELLAAGMEVGLHYNALDPPDARPWSREAFVRQLRLLQARLLGRPITNSKNHYTRWEGQTEFFHWLAEEGILIDETRGPSKGGGIGFPFGTCHPWFPMEGAARLPVMEICFTTQDLVVTAPASLARLFPQWVRERHGVCHLLFHPAHCDKPGVAEAMQEYVQTSRTLGMELWTDAEIYAWETARRAVRLERKGDEWRLVAERDLAGATVLMLHAQGEQQRYGFRFQVSQVDAEARRPLPLRPTGSAR